MELDLTEASEATYKKIVRGVAEDIGLDRVAFDVIEAAAPIIERQVRESVCKGITALAATSSDAHTQNVMKTLTRACLEIARGER